MTDPDEYIAEISDDILVEFNAYVDEPHEIVDIIMWGTSLKMSIKDLDAEWKEQIMIYNCFENALIKTFGLDFIQNKCEDQALRVKEYYQELALGI